MSRDFARDGDIDFGDVTAARFLVDSAWSALIFVKFDNTAADDSFLFGKWASSASARQFMLRQNGGASPEPLQAYWADSLEHTTTGELAIDTWYCVCISNAGTGLGSGAFINAATLDGTLVIDDENVGGTISDASTVTEPITIGGRPGPSDQIDGQVFGFIYVDGVVTQDEFLAYARDPATMGVYLKEKYGVQIWAPLEGIQSPEPDWSQNGNTGTVTAGVKGDNPPVGWLGNKIPFIGFTSGVAGNAQTLAAVAVGVAGLNRQLSAGRTLSATATGIAALVRTAQFFRDLNATASGVAGLVASTVAGQFFETIAAVATGVAGLNRKLSAERTLNAVATGNAAITLGLALSRTLDATATGVATLTRQASVFRTLAATATGVAGMAAGRLFEVTLSAIATAVATLSAAFTEAPEEPTVPFSGHAGIDGRRSRWKLRRTKWKRRR